MPNITSKRPSSGSTLEQLQGELEELKREAIAAQARKEQYQLRLEELNAWFEEHGFDVSGDLETQVEEHIAAVTECAEKLLREAQDV